MANVTKIVLTGGPCAGKTTALVRIIEHFTSLGFKVFTVPEVPTLYSQGGWNYLTPNRQLYYEGERAILATQLALEDWFVRLAETCTLPTLVVCDRGTLDISAYMTPDMWDELMSLEHTNAEQLRNRYDAVLHLVSAADGAEQYYTTATNANRYEQANEEGLRIARELDKKVIKAWTGHPHLRVIDNHDDFDRKLSCVIKEIASVLGLPQQVTEERKYIVKIVGDMPDCTESDIVQTYLVAEPGCEVRLRRRSWPGLSDRSVNVHQTKRRTADNELIVTERQVTNNLYESLLQQADPYRETIHKLRRNFIWRGKYFKLDTFLSPVSDLVILETQSANGQEVKFPPFIQIVEEVTGDSRYSNYNIARRAL